MRKGSKISMNVLIAFVIAAVGTLVLMTATRSGIFGIHESIIDKLVQP